MVTKLAEDYIEALAKELDINDNRYEQAQNRYHSLGKWLDRDASLVRNFSPSVYAQGSFALGTVIKPYTDNEEYDIDVACELKRLSKSEVTQEELKNLLGEEIESYRRAHSMKKELVEKRRCWELGYADGAQFHMDIVPALPNEEGVRLLLEKRNLNTQWVETAIGITDNEENKYRTITDDWPRSNPKGYQQWFKSRIAILQERKKVKLAESIRCSVEDIPDYRVKTPLQLSIMILKRHRDMMFADDQTNQAPISIIITTLAGHAYEGEEKIVDALNSILSKMNNFIQWDGQKYIIQNPSDPSENFADKWEEYPERKDAFFRWRKQAYEDFSAVTGQYSRKEITKTLAPYIGRNLLERVEIHIDANEPKSLLKSASAAPAATVAAEPSFGSEPRIPTKPKGFA